MNCNEILYVVNVDEFEVQIHLEPVGGLFITICRFAIDVVNNIATETDNYFWKLPHNSYGLVHMMDYEMFYT